MLKLVTEIMKRTIFMELSRNPILAFISDIAIHGDTQKEVIENTKKLVQSGKKMGLMVFEEKTKYMKVSREGNNLNGIVVNNNNKMKIYILK